MGDQLQSQVGGRKRLAENMRNLILGERIGWGGKQQRGIRKDSKEGGRSENLGTGNVR